MAGNGNGGPPWQASLAISILLLIAACAVFVPADMDALAGAIVGYLGGYWTPTRASVTQPPGPVERRQSNRRATR